MSMQEGRIAGSDTREAAATPTVRAAAMAAAMVGAPGWAGVLGIGGAWQDWVGLPEAAGIWLVAFAGAVGLVTAVGAWRLSPAAVVPSPASVASALAVGGVCVVIIGSERLAAFSLLLAVVAAGWVVGRSARVASRACVADITPAAAGLVVTGALTGLVFAGHIGLVASGSGIFRAIGWSAVYASAAAVLLVIADRRTSADLRRLDVRTRVLERSAEDASGGDVPALVLEEIAVRFGRSKILHNVTVQARSGELVAFVGGNGAGKSTLLRVAAGFVVPEAGRVEVAGEDLTTLRPEERAAAGLAFVSGARPVFPDMTVLENLRVAAFRTHLTARSFNAATEMVLELVPALSSRLSAKAGVLSGGQQRLLAVAQTMYRRPVVLLADELSLGLDVEARRAVLDLLRLLANEGMAVVAVDHDLPVLLPRADRAVLLVDGLTQEYDRPEQILTARADLLPATFLAGAGG